MPNSYRQAQVSFHAKLPNTIPIGDAVSLTNSVYLYTDTDPIRNRNNPNRRATKKATTSDNNETINNNNTNNNNNDNNDQQPLFAAGVVHMVSKHNNGTLNLWKLQFQEQSKYQSLVNISHLYRVCGHRFKVGHIMSHPILPFLLTNSAYMANSNDEDLTPLNRSSIKTYIPNILHNITQI
jgi:hypothetical protein